VGCFLSGVGVLAVFAGLLIFGAAKTVIHEIEGVLFIGFGFVIIGLGGVVTAVNDVHSILKTRLTIRQEPTAEVDEDRRWKDRFFGRGKKLSAHGEGINAVSSALEDGH
jgi:hypothetical protein